MADLSYIKKIDRVYDLFCAYTRFEIGFGF